MRDENSHKIIKITYLVDFFRTVNAGTERQLGHLLTHLSERGYSVQLISFQDSLFLQKEAAQLYPLISIVTLGAQSDISNSLKSLANLYLHLRKNKPHIIHTFFPSANSVGVIISRMAGIGNIISSRRDMGFNLNSKDILLLKLANIFVMRILTNSEAVQRKTFQLEKANSNKTHVIYNGIDLMDFQCSLRNYSNSEKIVGIIANLNRPVKRIDVFLKAAAIVKEVIQDAIFLIVGDGPLRPDLEKLASSLGIENNVKFLGRQKNVQELLSNMTVGVLCSDSEGLSNTIMEYMLAGLPVIATRVGGNMELIDHLKTGFLVPPGNPRKLAEGIIWCLKDINKSQEMGEAGKEEIIKSFSKEKMLQDTLNFYNSLLKNS